MGAFPADKCESSEEEWWVVGEERRTENSSSNGRWTEKVRDLENGGG